MNALYYIRVSTLLFLHILPSLIKREIHKMADSTVKKLAKPQLRGLLSSNFRFHAICAAIFCTINVALYKHFVCDARKKRYAEFYKNYDVEKDFHRMRNLGLFQSCQPDPK